MRFHEFFYKNFVVFFLSNTAFAAYGARMRGSGIKIVFRVLAREFKTIETSSGFAWFQGEN